ncbi:MAG: amidohydrolase family protein [Thermoplasmatota archaeon]
MPVFAGPILTRRGRREGWVHVEQGRILASGWGDAEQADVRGWILPSPVNAHTHVADAYLRRETGKPHTVKELFGPGGWKHRHLDAAPPEAQRAAAEDYVQEMANVGTAAFLDFREGGLAGIRWLRDLDLAARPLIYGRGTKGFDEDEAHRVLDASDGIGLSGLRDLRPHELDAWADACGDARKPLAIHVSEDQRDDIDHALSLQPAFVVHMTCGKPHDFEELADAKVPIVVCPRSNGHFGRRPPVAAMLEAGCKVALGTDNGMLQDGDLWSEARALRPHIEVEDLLRAATFHGRDLAALEDPELRRGATADLVVLPMDTLNEKATKPGFVVP